MTSSWHDNRRDDGVSVSLFREPYECWKITTADGRAVSVCPCCGKLFQSADAAKRVADFLYPPKMLDSASVMETGGEDRPGFWMNETSGVLRPAIEAYLVGGEMTREQIAAMRAYLRQWIWAPLWMDVDDLRDAIDGLITRDAIEAWLTRAFERGIEPI